MSLRSADLVYEASRLASATRETVDHRAVGEFVFAANRLLELTRGDFDDELLTQVRRLARFARWELHSLPIPLSSHNGRLIQLADAIKVATSRAAYAYGGNIADAGAAAAAVLEAVARDPSNPLGGRAAEILRLGDLRRSAVLVKRPEYAASIRRSLAQLGAPTEVVSQEELMAMEPVESLVIIGPARWYHPHVVTAPRAEIMCFVHYSWIADDEPQQGILDGARVNRVGVTVRDVVRQILPDAELLDAASLLPEIDWASMAAPATKIVAGAHDVEKVLARQFLLASGMAVFLEADEGPSIYVIDLDAEGEDRIRHQQSRGIQTGDYLLLRSARGAEDYVRAVANKHLGSRAPKLRADQERWKVALRERAKGIGVQAVQYELTVLGVQAQNVGYWMSPENIRTQRVEDFRILLEYVGLGTEGNMLWAEMMEIHSAHIWAGQELRRNLGEEVQRADLTALRREGWLQCELTVADAGSLTIFRVEARGPELVEIPPSWLRWPQEVSPLLWQG